MRVPTDRKLATWIRELMANGRLYAFYQTPEWRALRYDVLLDHNFECEMCADEGVYTRAVTVHHEHEVRKEPAMALTRWVEGEDGEMVEVLHPLCDHHHNIVHGRTFDKIREKKRRDDGQEPTVRGEIW